MHVVGALHRAAHDDRAVGAPVRGHRLTLDVEVFLVSCPVLAVDDHAGLAERRVDVSPAQGDGVKGRLVGRDVERELRFERLGDNLDRVTRGQRLVFRPRGDERHGLTHVVNVARGEDGPGIVEKRNAVRAG